MLSIKQIRIIRAITRLVEILNVIALIVGCVLVFGAIGSFDFAEKYHMPMTKEETKILDLRIFIFSITNIVNFCVIVIAQKFIEFIDYAIKYRLKKAEKQPGCSKTE